MSELQVTQCPFCKTHFRLTQEQLQAAAEGVPELRRQRAAQAVGGQVERRDTPRLARVPQPGQRPLGHADARQAQCTDNEMAAQAAS